MREYRSPNGSDNNAANPDWGQAGEELIRFSDVAYGDGVDSLAGDGRPSAREVSNILMDQSENTGNDVGMSNFLWVWGQFLDHDISISEAPHVGESAAIEVPLGDPFFDPFNTGAATIGFTRTEAAEGTGGDTGVARQQINDITPFIDGSNIYGSSAERLEALRGEDGKLKTSEGDLLPFNVDGLPNAMSTSDTMFLAGDVRANENVALTSMHTVWVREHNRIVDKLAEKNPEWDSEQLFQEARALVEAQLQIITYNEFLPHLIGEDVIADYEGYNADINPQIANEFSTAAFRIGHTMLSSTVARMEEDGSESEFGNLALQNAFFRPDRLSTEGGIDDVLRGVAATESETIDSALIGDVRNFLFGPPGSGGFDLGSLNVQRGRDHGLDDYNSVREAYGLDRVETFADITSDISLQEKLEALYGSVNDIDLIVGGMSEDAADGSLMGELFTTILAEQFTRLRDGDRFWHENRELEDGIINLADVSLAQIIEQNTGVDLMQDDVFSSYGREAGTDGDDVMFGQGNDMLMGEAGNDTMFSAAAKTQLEGGDGDDIMIGNTGKDTMNGGAGDDFMLDSDGDDILFGGAGDDVMAMGEGNDKLKFSTGDDVALGFNTAEDTLDFRAMNEISSVADLNIRSFDTGTLVSDTDGNSLWLDGVTDFRDVDALFRDMDGEIAPITGGEGEALIGSSGDDLFQDTDGTQYLFGEEGTDTLRIAANRSDLTINKTEDGSGFVVWNEDGAEALLWDMEFVEFDDDVVELADLA